jgi:hypothetical protein
MTNKSIFLGIWLLASIAYANEATKQLPHQENKEPESSKTYRYYLFNFIDESGSEPQLSAAEQRKVWLQALEDIEYRPTPKLRQEKVKAHYLKYNFSTLLTPRNEFLGYIAPNYRRIEIYFTSVSKNPANALKYTVSGISVVGTNKHVFSGLIEVDSVREFREMHFGIDEEWKDAGLKAQGVLIGHYRFEESRDNKHSGTFQGIMTLYWYVDKNEVLHYDVLEAYSDMYRNNQYVGTWTEYGNKADRVCNWGEYRIPFSGDLDIGAGEFGPNPKYDEQGWKAYER